MKSTEQNLHYPLLYFEDSVNAMAGTAALTVSAGETGFSASYLGKIAAVPGVKSAVPMIEVRTYFRSQGAKASESVVIFGVDLLKESAVRNYQTSDQQVIDDPLVFLNQPDSLIVTETFAAAHSLKIDSKLTLSSAQGAKTFTVRGMLSPVGPAKAFGGGVAIMDIDGAAMTFGKGDKIDRIDIVALPGFERKALADSIRGALGPAFIVETPETQADNLKKMVASFQAMLSFLGGLALLVGLFLAANSVSISVAERKREIAILRALGADRPTVLSLFIGESLLTGVLSAFLGAFGGRSLAQFMLPGISQALSGQTMSKIDVKSVNFTASDLGLAVGLGAAVAVLSALIPAYRATQITPVEALREPEYGASGENDGPQLKERLRFAVGILAAALLLVANLSEIAFLKTLAPLFGVATVVLLTPGLAIGSISLLERFAGPRLGFIPRLSLQNLLRTPSRTASNALSLVIGLMLVIVISSIALSFRSTISAWGKHAVSFGDVVISSNGRVVALEVQPLDEKVGAELDRIPGLEKVNGTAARGFRYIRAQYEGEQIGLKAFDDPSPEVKYQFLDTVGEDPQAQGPKLFGTDEPSILVSETFSVKFHKVVGDLVTLPVSDRNANFKVVGIMRDYAHPTGVIYMRRKIYKALWHDSLLSAYAVRAEHGVSTAEVKRRIEQSLGESHQLVVTLSEELVKQLAEVIDKSFAFNQAIEIAALLVALLGLINTLLISVLERTRELGVMRAIGMESTQLFGLIVGEAFYLGLVGSVVAAVLGVLISYGWVQGTLSRLLGWKIQYSIPWASVELVTFAGIGVALIATWFPARRAGQLTVREALEHE